jgi:hypothetical protein
MPSFPWPEAAPGKNNQAKEKINANRIFMVRNEGSK